MTKEGGSIYFQSWSIKSFNQVNGVIRPYCTDNKVYFYGKGFLWQCLNGKDMLMANKVPLAWQCHCCMSQKYRTILEMI